MKRTIDHTYCNPLVLPDYPNLPAKNEPHHGLDTSGWGREGKHLLRDWDILAEVDPQGLGKGAGAAGFHPDMTYRREAEWDVRATADPTVMYYDGIWYLYCTCGYVYDSKDFVHWTPHVDETFRKISAPMAPTVEHFRGKFYATANSVPLHAADNPLGPWTPIGEWTLPDGREFLANDPMIFADDDGRLYLYWGLGLGIFGAQLDPEQPNHLLTTPKHLITFNGENSWERGGNDNQNWRDGCIEGSWMYKRNGTYYLLYSVVGTEYYTYCMAAYVSDSPLENFRLQKRNPVSRSDKGLIRGGGHGSIVNGPNDTIWCFYTIPVVIDHIFERRIGMDPCGIDEEGCLYALTGSSTPQFAPGILPHPEEGNATGLLPCTGFSLTKASSYAPGHRPLYALDEALHTWWQHDAGDPAPALEVSLRDEYFLSAVRIIWKDVGLDLKAGIVPGPYQYMVEAALKDGPWTTVADESRNSVDLTVDYRTFAEIRADRVRLRILGAPAGLTPGVINFTAFGESAARRERWGHTPLLENG